MPACGLVSLFFWCDWEVVILHPHFTTKTRLEFSLNSPQYFHFIQPWIYIMHFFDCLPWNWGCIHQQLSEIIVFIATFLFPAVTFHRACTLCGSCFLYTLWGNKSRLLNFKFKVKYLYTTFCWLDVLLSPLSLITYLSTWQHLFCPTSLATSRLTVIWKKLHVIYKVNNWDLANVWPWFGQGYHINS